MANQIPYLTPSRARRGAVYHWKPSPRLRRLGWTNLRLGTDFQAAVQAAILRNAEVAARLAAPADAPAPPDGSASRAPLRPRWRDLVDAYLRSRHFTEELTAKSRKEYRSRIAALTRWALDGELRLDQLDRQMVLDLRDTLVEDRRKSRTANLLRMLSTLLQFAEDKRLIAASPATRMKVPSPPKRKKRLLREHLPFLLDAAAALDFPHVAIGIVLGFYSMQREGDLLAATGFQIRPVDDVSSDARRTLAGGDGKVAGLWLQQAKTGEWVGVALAPWARGPVEAAIAAGRDARRACTNLILYRREDRPCPENRFQRDFRAVVNRAVADATERQDHALARLLGGEEGKPRDAIQFRDLRRSGMCWLRELGVAVPLIAAISGHSIEETQKILDTYMPRDTRAAAEGIAIAVARQHERDAADAAELARGEQP